MIETLELTVWGRDFSLPVKYDCYEGETVTEEQEASLRIFADHPAWLEKAKKKVESYCKQQVQQDDENDKKDNVFSYVKPEYLFVKREDVNPRILLMCKYRYDLEHGLAIVFSKNGKIIVGSQDIILKPETNTEQKQ
ncbi:MAG: hypothetical protein SPL71_08650 [Oribacterium sp.]|nr:hypothetical protein [Oribacterium sp.]